MNRAVHDDIVAIEVFPSEKWSAPSNLVLEEKPDSDEIIESDNDEDIVEEDVSRKTKDEVQFIC